MLYQYVWVEVHAVVAEIAALITLVLAVVAELIHARRCRRLAPLAFGPKLKPRIWARSAGVLRIVSLAALCWGMTTLMNVPPMVHTAQEIPAGDYKHVVLVLDVSPSMKLEDAGTEGNISRTARASEVLESFFKRVVIQQYRLSVVAVYNGAKAVVIDTKDVEVVRNILNDLPMYQAFPTGKTNIFAGLQVAADMAKPWKPKSATVLLVSDGDTVAATGMPKMPASVKSVVVVGVGDPVSGSFIDGQNSRQDVSTLRQVAHRLGGTYHNGNENHLSTGLINQMTKTKKKSQFEKLGRREYALIACGLGGVIFSMLPILLHFFGTGWRPGVQAKTIAKNRQIEVARQEEKQQLPKPDHSLKETTEV